MLRLGNLKTLAAGALSAVLLALTLVAMSPPQVSSALSGADFDPGNIISDAAFYDSNAMTEAEIQSFLDSKIGRCLNSSCLNVGVFSTTSRPREISGATGNLRCNAYNAGTPAKASTIIFKVQQACGISAKVILATLQKEQALVTSTAPAERTLDRAMGYACPDTGTCTVLGFDTQIYFGALQLNTYKAARFGIQPGVQSIRLNPIASCGSRVVNVQNYATAALYNYTPYTPNEAALANLGGTGDGCSSYGNRNFWLFYNQWFGSTTGQVSPIGDVNSVVATVGGAAIGGWAFDPDTSDPIQVQIHVDGVYHSAIVANQNRPDVAAVFPGRGPNHGYSTSIALAGGLHSVCIYGVNVGPGSNSLIGCRSVSVAQTGSNPQGGVNEMNITSTRDGVFIRGFVFDADTTAPILADVWVNGAYRTTLVADGDRPDVQAAFPAQGAKHGFSTTIGLGLGSNQVCVYGINVGGGTINTLLECRIISVIQLGSSPIGYVNNVLAAGAEAAVWGWAFDADTQDSILVDAWVNGSYRATLVADQSRPDVNAAYPSQTGNHGFGGMLGLTGGANNVCLYGINVGGGNHALLGCQTVWRVTNVPRGDINSISGGVAAVSTYGWVFDADTTAPILADVWINGAYSTTMLANVARADVQAAFPRQGPSHGFAASIPTSPGVKSVCIYGIDVGGSSHTLLGCRTVTVG